MLPLNRQNEYRRRYAGLAPGWQTSGDTLERLVRESIGPATRLLDLGGGRGGLIENIHAQVRAAATLDPDLASLREHRAPAIPRACGLAEDLPFPAQSFDLVIAVWLLEHLPRPQAVFAEVHRILSPGGSFLFLTPNAGHPLLRLNAISRLLPWLQRRLVPRLYARAEADTFPVHYRANRPQALRRLADQAGFSLHLHLISDPTYTAFNDPLFRLSAAMERLIPPSLKIHILGVAVK